MPRITYRGRDHQAREGQTVLDALLEAGEDIPYSCRAGACGACIVRATAGEVPAEAQVGLRDAWRALGYFHACRAPARTDLSVEPLGAGARTPATVVERKALSSTVALVRVQLAEPMQAIAGQYVTLHRGAVARSYSIAAQPAAGQLELHVRRVPGGKLSPYLCDLAQPGDTLEVQGPLGSCVYVPGRPDDPLILAATGTGLAPLWGVLHDALAAGHRGSITLFHGALTPDGLYLVDELRALAGAHSTLRYRPNALEPQAGGRADLPELEHGALDDLVIRDLPRAPGVRAFVCGAPDFVATLKRKLFLAGVALRDIAADAFLPGAGTT